MFIFWTFSELFFSSSNTRRYFCTWLNLSAVKSQTPLCQSISLSIPPCVSAPLFFTSFHLLIDSLEDGRGFHGNCFHPPFCVKGWTALKLSALTFSFSFFPSSLPPSLPPRRPPLFSSFSCFASSSFIKQPICLRLPTPHEWGRQVRGV